jgi:hypothetical protein
MRRAASRLSSYFLLCLSLLVTSTGVLAAPYYQIHRKSHTPAAEETGTSDAPKTQLGLVGSWPITGVETVENLCLAL